MKEQCTNKRCRLLLQFIFRRLSATMTFCYTVLSKTEKTTLPRDQNGRILELQRMVHRNKNYRRFKVQFNWKAFWKSKDENVNRLFNRG
jgi:hypothetical protein